jgi:hypothetical protein
MITPEAREIWARVLSGIPISEMNFRSSVHPFCKEMHFRLHSYARGNIAACGLFGPRL